MVDASFYIGLSKFSIRIVAKNGLAGYTVSLPAPFLHIYTTLTVHKKVIRIGKSLFVTGAGKRAVCSGAR